LNLEHKLYLKGPGREGEEGGSIERVGEERDGGLVGGEGAWENEQMDMKWGAYGPKRLDRPHRKYGAWSGGKFGSDEGTEPNLSEIGEGEEENKRVN
jgi:hypothetical protein